ncbi:hypothetical protein I7I53_00562 [Histoplasma capsulatum var. duboisii H88]|uniref:Uncharacterized protein n=1 Tax=Ajellomyces capsulatus (strain H88) TaxID=544711 RepID=A0A8A1LLJ6_AJEC8|nr:hypothetical protein I7I53_00562 [Histoplasma capsulatum var. duboisii H88]
MACSRYIDTPRRRWLVNQYIPKIRVPVIRAVKFLFAGQSTRTAPHKYDGLILTGYNSLSYRDLIYPGLPPPLEAPCRATCNPTPKTFQFQPFSCLSFKPSVLIKPWFYRSSTNLEMSAFETRFLSQQSTNLQSVPRRAHFLSSNSRGAG